MKFGSRQQQQEQQQWSSVCWLSRICLCFVRNSVQCALKVLAQRAVRAVRLSLEARLLACEAGRAIAACKLQQQQQQLETAVCDLMRFGVAC